MQSTINTALNGLITQIENTLASVPNSAQVATFIQNQLMDDEFILDALAGQLQNAGASADSNVAALDALLANDVLELTELNAIYEINTLGGNNGSGGS